MLLMGDEIAQTVSDTRWPTSTMYSASTAALATQLWLRLSRSSLVSQRLHPIGPTGGKGRVLEGIYTRFFATHYWPYLASLVPAIATTRPASWANQRMLLEHMVIL